MANLTLTPADIVTYVEWLVFMPNWSFVATPNYYGEDNTVGVMIQRAVPNTDYPPLYVDEPLLWTKTVIIDVDNVNTLDDVGHKILTTCIEWLNDPVTNTHEAREFFRVNINRDPTATGYRNFVAPFHPHRFSGHRAWEARIGRSAGRQGC